MPDPAAKDTAAYITRIPEQPSTETGDHLAYAELDVVADATTADVVDGMHSDDLCHIVW